MHLSENGNGTFGFHKLWIFLDPVGKYQLVNEHLYAQFVCVGADI
jgi:hypothetical protein